MISCAFFSILIIPLCAQPPTSIYLLSDFIIRFCSCSKLSLTSPCSVIFQSTLFELGHSSLLFTLENKVRLLLIWVIPGAVNIPNETIASEAIQQLPDKEQLILVYCRSGNRSKQASEKLVNLGYTNIVEFGGINDWSGEVVTQ